MKRVRARRHVKSIPSKVLIMTKTPAICDLSSRGSRNLEGGGHLGETERENRLKMELRILFQSRNKRLRQRLICIKVNEERRTTEVTYRCE